MGNEHSKGEKGTSDTGPSEARKMLLMGECSFSALKAQFCK